MIAEILVMPTELREAGWYILGKLQQAQIPVTALFKKATQRRGFPTVVSGDGIV